MPADTTYATRYFLAYLSHCSAIHSFQLKLLFIFFSAEKEATAEGEHQDMVGLTAEALSSLSAAKSG